MVEEKEQKAQKVLERFDEHYRLEKKEFLKHYSNPFQLLIAAILSAQSTDKQVNAVTKDLFKHFPDPESFVNSSTTEIEKNISKVGLYKTKAKYIYSLSKKLIEEYNSKVPTSIDKLIKLPGVGRKTANVLLNDWYGINEGIAIDTHVKRISYRIGLTNNTTPLRIEEDLKQLFPKERWGHITRLFITHGREICYARFPKCSDCFLIDICDRKGVEKSR
ncbi:MAG: endonuclease III [Candidatus Heimdallarchaeaceae archaeon]